MYSRENSAVAPAITTPLILVFATAVGVIVTNLFASQPLVGPIAASLGLGAGTVGLIGTPVLLGYAAGLVFLVPAADLLENRRLIVRTLCAAALAAAVSGLAMSASAFFAATFVLGATCSVIQMMVPSAAAMAAPHERGRVVGDVMSGLMVGILFSRPLASLVAYQFGWRTFYGLSAVLLVVVASVLSRFLPERKPATRMRYPLLIASLWQLLCDEPVLRQRSATAALSMAAFTAFWTTIALRLNAAPFNLDETGVAVFALVGAGGALCAPLAGRLGDRGWTRQATYVAHIAMIAAMALAALADWMAQERSHGWSTVSLFMLGGAGVLLDIGVTGDQTLGRREINLRNPDARGRLNGLFVSLFFVGGAVGSVASGYAWAHGSWLAVCGAGAAFAVAALLIHSCVVSSLCGE
jgi:predicted MFS family arabinose efflux permease